MAEIYRRNYRHRTGDGPLDGRQNHAISAARVGSCPISNGQKP